MAALLALVAAALVLLLLARAYRAGRFAGLAAWAHRVDAEISELEQRQRLLAEPWREEFLHWGADGRLHGTRAPGPGCRRSSVTSTGWCPGLLRPAGRPGRGAGSSPT